VSSFENYDVFMKELELFVTYVTDSLWCYLRLHGLTVKVEENNRSSRRRIKKMMKVIVWAIAIMMTVIRFFVPSLRRQEEGTSVE
jgi:hypothetical protein